MNDETKKALVCGAQLRQVVTDIIEKIEYLDLSDDTNDPRMQRLALRDGVQQIKKLLTDNGLYDRVYPLEPFENEDLKGACRRIFGTWIANDVLDRRGR